MRETHANCVKISRILVFHKPLVCKYLWNREGFLFFSAGIAVAKGQSEHLDALAELLRVGGGHENQNSRKYETIHKQSPGVHAD